MAVPKDKELYERVKKTIYKKIPKHSAYRSGLLVKTYKERYFKKHKSKDAYVGKKETKKGLSRWFKEDWRTATGSKTYEKKGDIFRPTKKITKKTPATMKEVGKKKIKKAEKIKAKKGRVKNFLKIK